MKQRDEGYEETTTKSTYITFVVELPFFYRLATSNTNVTNSFRFVFTTILHSLLSSSILLPSNLFWLCMVHEVSPNCWDVLYMDMNLFPWYSTTHAHVRSFFLLFYCFVSFFFILPNLFCVQHCVCSCHFTFRYLGYKYKTICNYVMADEWCFVIRFPIHDTTALKFNFKPLFNFT